MVWSQQNYLKLLLTVRYSKSYGCCTRDLPRRKVSMKMNDMNTIYVIWFIHRYLSAQLASKQIP